MNWTYTKDHVPSYEECKGRVMVCHHTDAKYPFATFPIRYESEYSAVLNHLDRYILIDIPEPEPEPVKCKLCGEMPKIYKTQLAIGEWCVQCAHLYVYGSTRAEAIENWNKLNG